MPKTKKNSKVVKDDKKPNVTESEEKDSKKSTIPAADTVVKDTTDNAAAESSSTSKDVDIRVLYSAECCKLTTRGKGNLQYEIGFRDDSDESFIRIVSSGSSGAFSKGWVAITDIKKIVDNVDEGGCRALILQDLHKGKSANNHGFLGAVLKHLGVFTTEPDQPTILYFENWDSLMEKIESLKNKKQS
ncbi:MAG: hypothetical protein KAR45_09685 [Desulfobacteraceae bacterium]|nr:hypothetical protein [Desulfobacteraceae bacterium]